MNRLIAVVLSAMVASAHAHSYFACLHAEACADEAQTGSLVYCNAPFEGHKFIQLTDQLSNTAVCARCQFTPVVSLSSFSSTSKQAKRFLFLSLI